MRIFEQLTVKPLTAFPGYPAQPPGSRLMGHAFADSPLGHYEVYGPAHTSFDAEWPIPISMPASIRGFRHALELSQAKFAERIKVSRINIERWEGGQSRPFRGHALSVVDLLRPHAQNPLAVGQLFNVVAAVVCPTLTRPSAIYTGGQLAAPLAEGRMDHRDLAPPLIASLVAAEVIVALDEVHEDDPDGRYLPLVGAKIADTLIEPWDTEVRAIARNMSAEDRKTWFALGRRLASRPVENP
ncbi:helix-turn-helix domain-containing protein [Actinoplanes sp. NPDC049668]|uniref:helix-turn-helix domain-containing protein n=1 Tax=unclassified Actinoplanes TaxID=2626549 RepID=UPI0033A406CA